jgi:hypothetical protein
MYRSVSIMHLLLVKMGQGDTGGDQAGEGGRGRTHHYPTEMPPRTQRKNSQRYSSVFLPLCNFFKGI